MLLQFDEMVKDATASVCLEFAGQRVWIPKSVIIGEPDLNHKMVEVQVWFVLERGLEVYSVD